METIRFSPIGKEDCSFGTGSFEVTLADGRVVMLSQIDIGAIINAGLSTLTLTGLTLTAPAISAPVLSGTATGTYTLAGTPTLTAPTLTTPTMTSPTVSSGAVTLTGGQLAFPATQVPSAGANTLDDYEEGTWTPSVGGTATYISQAGQYVKIGKVVIVTFDLLLNAIGTGSASDISGLPFPALSNIESTFTIQWQVAAASYVYIVGRVPINQSFIRLYGATAAAATLASVNAMQNGTLIIGGGSYITTA